ncbi:MAG: DUF504 domain-containing protein [Methanomicrobia archaeon]|nr:DUF504 domain-containing protein [Methanomicrobia archaeon]RLF92703.1 MAG: hypothetical protein DRN45_06845 [Thermococci archaeon]RLF93479.1 MAG: hypothetical protein DRN50_07170 [Thermococci archaeon]RLF97948.1 MAG: hypothetical protein DRN58_07865 [Thermococci archaeon]HEC88114.1 DUF504 domain-containing protein [Thermoplasmata archaeon]
MKHLTDIINKIRWDKRENEEDYSFGYLDNGIQNFDFKSIDFEQSTKFALAVKTEHEIKFIPFHKIKRVYRKGEIVWEC